MTKDFEKRLLILLGCAFLVVVSVSAATSSLVTTPQGQTKKQPKPGRKRVPPIGQPPIVVISPSTSLIKFCPPWTRSMDNCPASREVELSVNVPVPAVDIKLLYVWTVTAGRIRGEGQKVIWDLNDAAEGTYTANVEVTDDKGLTGTASTKATIAMCNCFTLESPCPTVSVSCPSIAESNHSMQFHADVYGGDPTVTSTYTWSVNAGKISSCQGTSTITVDASDVTSGSVTAKVSIGGHEANCVNTTSCTTRTAGPVAKPGGWKR